MEEQPDDEAIAIVCQWARQTLLLAINLTYFGKEIRGDMQAHLNACREEAEHVALRLFDEAKAENPRATIGDAVLIYAGKVLSWCSERRYE